MDFKSVSSPFPQRPSAAPTGLNHESGDSDRLNKTRIPTKPPRRGPAGPGALTRMHRVLPKFNTGSERLDSARL
eukprot:757981-Hanusia_phi.AAC.2